MRLHFAAVSGRLLALLIALASATSGAVRGEGAGGAMGPKPLIDFASPEAAKQVVAGKGNPRLSDIKVDATGISVIFPRPQKGDADHPSIHVVPAAGKTWDLSAYGHVEARLTSTSDRRFDIIMHVVPEGEGSWVEKNYEVMSFNPGETKVLKVIFGYQKGFKPGAVIKPSSIAEIYIFLWGKDQARSFRVEELRAAGLPDEKPVEAPNSPAAKPAPPSTTKAQ